MFFDKSMKVFKEIKKKKTNVKYVCFTFSVSL